MWYAFVMYLSKSYPKRAVLLVLRAGPQLKINLSNIYDLGNVLEVFARKVYTPDLIRMQNIARVVDIGAATGDFSIYITSSNKDCHCISFEPNRDSFELCKENIKINNLENSIKVYPLAVSGKGGKIKIGEKICDSVSLGEIFKDYSISRCDLLKMDIEGGEYDIFFNIDKDILDKINAIAMEYHIFDNDKNLDSLKRILTDAGFSIVTTPKNVYGSGYLYAFKN